MVLLSQQVAQHGECLPELGWVAQIARDGEGAFEVDLCLGQPPERGQRLRSEPAPFDDILAVSRWLGNGQTCCGIS